MKYVLGAVAMPTPIINGTNDSYKYVSGKASIGEKINVVVGTQKYSANISNYVWKIVLTKTLKPGTKILAYSSINDTKSKSVATYVLPFTPVIKQISSKSLYIKGVSTKGAKVIAKIGTKTYTATASLKTGAFSIKIIKFKAGTAAYIYSVSGGKTSLKKKYLFN